MTAYSGFVLIPHETYLAWKNAVAGNGYDADGSFGWQCWDLAAEFWYNVGFPTSPLYPQTGPNLSAYECWTVSRDVNASYNGTTYFDLIYNLADVKQGDVVVFNQSAFSTAGHIGFADEDYSGSGYLKVLGQNQGTTGTPPPVIHPNGAAYGTTATVTNLSLSLVPFLGAFRYRGWSTPPTPTVQKKPAQKRFPWVLYARKFRNGRR